MCGTHQATATTTAVRSAHRQRRRLSPVKLRSPDRATRLSPGLWLSNLGTDADQVAPSTPAPASTQQRLLPRAGSLRRVALHLSVLSTCCGRYAGCLLLGGADAHREQCHVVALREIASVEQCLKLTY